MTALGLWSLQDGRSLRAAGSTVVLSVLLGVVGGVPLAYALALPVAGVVLSLWLRSRPAGLAVEYGLVPALLAVLALAIGATPSLVVGALAGVTGLALLLWNAETPAEAIRGPDPVSGLPLPALCVAVALVAAVALPSAPGAVGPAAVAIVVALGLLAWALGEAWRRPLASAQTL